MSASGTVKAELQRELTVLREEGQTGLSGADIDRIVDSVMTHLQADVRVADLRLYEELAALAEYIQKARAEVAELRPREIQDEFIPSATDELDAVVGATEQATHSIMDRAEQIENLCEKMPAEVAEDVSNAVTEIFMACGFQDITGQRITKVVKALKHIETRVDALLSAFGHDPMGEKAHSDKSAASGGETQASSGEIDEKSLLNGPQMPDEAIRQADIDKFFN